MYFFVADDGHLWVLPYRGKSRTMDVFAPDGRYLGAASLPRILAHSPLPGFRGNRIASVVVDEDGVQSVMLMRIEKPAR